METLKEYYNKFKFQSHLALLTVLFLINCFWGEFVFISLGFAIFLVLVSSIEEAFSTLVFCIPYIAIASPYSYSLYLLAVIVFVIKGYIQMYVVDKKKPSKYLIFSMALFIFYLMIPIAPYNLNFVVKFSCFVLLFLLTNMFINYPDKLRLKCNVGLLAVSFLASIFLFLTYPISPYLKKITVIFYGSESFIRFTGLFPNPNPLAMVCEICLAILTLYIVTGKSKPHDLWFFIIFTAIGVATISKTFIIIFAFIMLVLFLYVLKKSPKHALLALCALIPPIIFLLVFKNDFVMHYFNRFVTGIFKGFSMEKILNIITTNRYLLWNDYLHHLIKNPLILIFGGGLGAPRISYESPHNFFITLIYNLGLLGSALLVLVIIAIIRVYRKNTTSKFNWAVLIPLFVIALIMLVEDFFLFIRV